MAWDDPNVQGDDGTAQPVMLMHNAGRPTDGAVKASGVKTGDVLVGTEEVFTTTNGRGETAGSCCPTSPTRSEASPPRAAW